jgi:hypothetical protein
VILDGKAISLTGLIVLYVSGGAALLYAMFAFSGWRKAFLALGIAAAGLTVSVLALKYGLHSYEQEKLRRKGMIMAITSSSDLRGYSDYEL